MEFKVDGKTVFAATGGKAFDANLPAVVFVHGAGMDHTVWQLQTRYFAWHGHSVLALDLPGHGRSEGPALESIETMADWMVMLMDATGVEQAALVGHSLGAYVGLEVAARAPGRVRALALLGIAGKMSVHPDLQASADAGEHLAYDLLTSWAYSRRAHLGGNRAPGLWMMGGSTRLLERDTSRALAIDLAACNAYANACEAAAKVRCPTLFLLGASDRMTPLKQGRRLAGTIRDSRVTVLDCGHMTMIERPDETLDALAEAVAADG